MSFAEDVAWAKRHEKLVIQFQIEYAVLETYLADLDAVQKKLNEHRKKMDKIRRELVEIEYKINQMKK